MKLISQLATGSCSRMWHVAQSGNNEAPHTHTRSLGPIWTTFLIALLKRICASFAGEINYQKTQWVHTKIYINILSKKCTARSLLECEIFQQPNAHTLTHTNTHARTKGTCVGMSLTSFLLWTFRGKGKRKWRVTAS